MKLQIDNRQFNCQIVRSNRKTIQLRILTPDQLRLAAPARITLAELETMLLSKADWILKQSAKLQSLAATPLNDRVSDGAKVLYLGQSYTIQLRSSHIPNVNCFNGLLIVNYPANQVADTELILRDWYIKAAANVFQQKTAFWAPRLGVNPRRVSIRDQKTRWGSCSNSGNIAYNWRVVMAPPLVIDYLVVHELCHLVEANHSTKFWQLVESVMPTYKEQRKWLKDNGRLLARIL